MTHDPGRYVYDWQAHEGTAPGGAPRVTFADETLRDGLQSPSARHPAVDERFALLEAMVPLGITAANVGFPGAGVQAARAVAELCGEAAAARLPIALQCAARTVEDDLRPVAEIAAHSGVPLEVGLFVGSSPLRRATEGWDLDWLQATVERCVAWAVRERLAVLFVTEDTTRSHPEDLRRLYGAAVRAGAQRVCAADTAGFATPVAAFNLARFLRRLLDEAGAGSVGIDWHGHNDRGLAVANALAAGLGGATRLHGTALGVGERVGNAPMEQLLVNARLLGWAAPELASLMDYARIAAAALGVAIPVGAPVVGADAFATASGVHAAALLKALQQRDGELLDAVYSSVPAGWLGRRQEVEVGPFSGASNVRYWLIAHGYGAAQPTVERILHAAKAASRTLSDAELHELAGAGAERG
jgi:2-isopropylmalate synthase